MRQCSKPAKPYPDFPLFPHDTGRWAKKIKGQLHYFGPWNDPQGALQRYLDQKDDLHAGRTPRKPSDGLTVKELVNRFLEAGEAKIDSGELAKCTWRDYYGTCKKIIRFFGKNRLVEDLRGDDFDKFRAQLAKGNNLVSLRNQITRVRLVFNYADKAGLIDRPIRYGANFKRPSEKTIRRFQAGRRKESPRMFEAADIRRMLEHAGSEFRAMILLGVNAGFGCADVGRLPIAAIDLDDGWIEFPRPKTGTNRRVPLWPETIAAIRDVLKTRPAPASDDHSDLLFLTAKGGSWHKETTRYLTEQFSLYLKTLDASGEAQAKAANKKPPAKLYRAGRSFYTFRHVFETIAGESTDQVAVDAIMGHERGDMASQYRERISDKRLRAVVDVVRAWLFAEAEPVEEEKPDVVPFRIVS